MISSRTILAILPAASASLDLVESALHIPQESACYDNNASHCDFLGHIVSHKSFLHRLIRDPFSHFPKNSDICKSSQIG